MQPADRSRILDYLKPLYQDLDGVSHLDRIERVSVIARRLYVPLEESQLRAFELLLVFQGLGKWLSKVGNRSRTELALSSAVSPAELRGVMRSLGNLMEPGSGAERALAAAILVEDGGLHALAQRFAHARREGITPADVAREELGTAPPILDWMPPLAQQWLSERRLARAEVCRKILEELEGE